MWYVIIYGLMTLLFCVPEGDTLGMARNTYFDSLIHSSSNIENVHHLFTLTYTMSQIHKRIHVAARHCLEGSSGIMTDNYSPCGKKEVRWREANIKEHKIA